MAAKSSSLPIAAARRRCGGSQLRAGESPAVWLSARTDSFQPFRGRETGWSTVRAITDTNIWRVNLSDPREPPPTQLIASTRADSDPQYSPDGKSIAFNSSRSGNTEVWVCDADGSNPRQLVTMGQSATPRWSPDSQRIVFDSNDGGAFQVYEVSVARRPVAAHDHPSAANDARPSLVA